MDLRAQGQSPATLVEAERVDRHSATWPLPRLACAAAVAVAVAVPLAAMFTGYLHQRDLAREAGLNAQRLAQAYDDLSAHSAKTLAALQEKVEALQANDLEHVRTIEALTRMRDSMAARLAAGERRLRDLAAERDRALGAVEDLRSQIEARDRQLEDDAERRADLADELAQTQAHLILVSDQRDAGQSGLRWRLASIQAQLERLGARQALAQSWLGGWVLGNLATLEDLVAGTGLDVDTLVARANNGEVGQGGPFEAVVDQAPEESPLPDAVADHLMRLSALQKVTSSLPLAAPLDQFQITSGFGKRRDPFTKGWAFHSGLDLGASRGSKALATAPGIVITAGPSGPYGNMVEIDHGMGVVTRYGHLKSVAVEVGHQVGFREPVGVIGSSGRSTSRHLHYEIRVDDKPYDPRRFLEAGRYLVAVFDLGQPGAAGGGGRGGPQN